MSSTLIKVIFGKNLKKIYFIYFEGLNFFFKWSVQESRGFLWIDNGKDPPPFQKIHMKRKEKEKENLH